jgi:hypothetical protein
MGDSATSKIKETVSQGWDGLQMVWTFGCDYETGPG